MIKLELNPSIFEETEILEKVEDGTTFASRVLLFDDDVHTFDEVITQIIKAIACDRQKAEALCMQVHNNGKAAVYEGDIGNCLRVSAILEEIALHTQIEC